MDWRSVDVWSGVQSIVSTIEQKMCSTNFIYTYFDSWTVKLIIILIVWKKIIYLQTNVNLYKYK